MANDVLHAILMVLTKPLELCLPTPLPDSVQEIADVIGRERALYLIGQLPRYANKDHRWSDAAPSRVLLYVPKVANLSDGHALVRILGWADAIKLSQVFGGEILKPANCSSIYKRYRDAQIVRLAEEGLDSPRIAELIDVSASQVRLILQRAYLAGGTQARSCRQ